MAQPAHQHARGGLSNSTKVAIGIIVLVGIVAFLFYDPAGLNFGLKNDGLTDIFGNTIGGKVDFKMTSSESFLVDDLLLKDASILLNGVHSEDTVIGDLIVSNKGKDTEVSFEVFNGRLRDSGVGISLEGTAAAATTGGTSLKPKVKKFSVSASMKPDSYAVDPVTIDRIRLVKVYGSIERAGGEKSTTNLANSTVEISGFEGKMSFDGKSYVLSGSADEIRGKSFTLRGE